MGYAYMHDIRMGSLEERNVYGFSLNVPPVSDELDLPMPCLEMGSRGSTAGRSGIMISFVL
jgi:hypothetical protein